MYVSWYVQVFVMAVVRVADLLLPVADHKDGSVVKGRAAVGRSLAPGLMTILDTCFGIWWLFTCPQLQHNNGIA
jgi:hypothetical protein